MGEQRNSDPRRRTEPSLGKLDPRHDKAPPLPECEIVLPGETRTHHAAPPSSASCNRRSRRSWLWPLLVILMLTLGTLIWSKQDFLRGLLPRTQLNRLLVRADQALAAGRLDGNKGDSARELYTAVRTLKVDNERANAGLRKVGKVELDQARQAIAKADYAAAQSALEHARELLGGGDEVNDLARQLVQTRQSQAQTDVLITQARQALAQGRIDGDQGAAKLYRQALQTDPDNAVARHGLNQVGDALAAQARSALAGGKLDRGDSLVGEIASLMPNYGDLPALRGHLAQARQQAQASIRDHLQKARDAFRAGHFNGDGDDNALAQFRAVLKLDADNAQASAGIAQVTQALVQRANALANTQHYSDASGSLAVRSQAHSKPPQSDQGRPKIQLDRQQQARVDDLLKRAQAALDIGDIMLPPGASAYDLYSEVLNIDGNNGVALAGLQGLASHAVMLFDHAVTSGDLLQADKMLKVFEQLVPGDASQTDMRQRLADAWLDRAEKRLRNGHRAAAQQALEAASKLRPDAPRLQALRTRVGNS